MIISINLTNQAYKIDSENPLDISIPLKFNGEQPNAYGVEKATSNPCKAGELVGDTRQGGSCNFEQYTFIPHCNGTHTECVGHITNERIPVRDCLQDAFVFASLISVKPENASETNETYLFELSKNDFLITRKEIQNSTFEIQNSNALIVRTLPNDESKLTREYGEENIPPFFSIEAMEFIVELGVKHLLVDLPSIDRIFDDGKLSNHRKFWNVEAGKFETNVRTRINSSLTELIYVPNEIKDGNYLLNLQIAAFDSDASPSRPLLFELL
ncbi:MAG: cyclase family protein [Acidobacteriota bacterium]|jgi:kynurenine formamidase|nr:cyclase family protein [Acidobacteriota bacterium]